MILLSVYGIVSKITSRFAKARLYLFTRFEVKEILYQIYIWTITCSHFTQTSSPIIWVIFCIWMNFPMSRMILKVTTHYNDPIMSTTASQITSLTIVYSTVYLGVDQRKHPSSASLAFVRRIHRWPVNFPHKGPVTRKMFPLHDVIMIIVLESNARPKPCTYQVDIFSALVWVPINLYDQALVLNG